MFGKGSSSLMSSASSLKWFSAVQSSLFIFWGSEESKSYEKVLLDKIKGLDGGTTKAEGCKFDDR